jgi:hypothetical protein
MPFGMTATEQHAWFEYGGGQEQLACWDVGGFGANGCHDFACKSRDAHF